MEKLYRKVLITGHRGFIGSNLIKLLSEYLVIGYDIVEGNDILDLNKLRQVDCDVIIHLAAKCVVDESWRKREEYLTTNIIGTANVLSLGKRTVFISSCAAQYPESSPYALSKLAGEMLNDHLTLRLANVYGPNQNPKHGRAIDNFIKGAKNGEMVVYGDAQRDYIHVSDVCAAIKLALKSESTGVMGIGTGVLTSTNNLAEKIRKIYNPDAVIRHESGRKEALVGSVETERAEKELGFKASISLEEGLFNG